MRRAPALASLLLCAAPAWAAPHWGFESHLGGAWNSPVPLRIEQVGEAPIRHSARFATRAWEPPLYYAHRLVRHDAHGAWALELVHHKLHLVNPPPQVQSFAVSHGYNLLHVLRLSPAGTWRTHAGAGLVLAHPENTVRGRRLDESRGLLSDGYHLAGPSLVTGLARRWLRRSGASGWAEARVVAAWARVPVADGHADVPHLGVHATIGLGWSQRR